VTIQLLFKLSQIPSFMKRPNILRLITILFEKRMYVETSKLSLLNTFCMFLIYKYITLYVHYTQGINPIPLFYLIFITIISPVLYFYYFFNVDHVTSLVYTGRHLPMYKCLYNPKVDSSLVFTRQLIVHLVRDLNVKL